MDISVIWMVKIIDIRTNPSFNANLETLRFVKQVEVSC